MKKLKGVLVAMFFLCLSAAFACGTTGGTQSSQESSKESSGENVLSSESLVESSIESSVESSVEASTESSVAESSSEAESSTESSVESSVEASTESSVEASTESSSEAESSTESSVESSEDISSESSVENSSESSVENSSESSVENSSESSVEDSSADPIPVPPVSQGDDRTEMPTYDGNATDLGFPEGTETVYTIVSAAWSEEQNIGWDNRIVMQVDSAKDYLKLNVVFTAPVNSVMIWPAGDDGAHGNYSLTANGATATTADADPNRKVFIVDENGFQVTSLEANTLYTVYVYINEDDTSIQLSSFTDATIYVANIECADGDVNPIIPNFYMQDTVTLRPIYAGDVTEIGFAEDTLVMVLETTGSAWDDGAYVRTDAETNCLTVNFAFSAVPADGSQIRIFAWYDGAYGWIKSVVNCAASDNMVSLPKDIEILNADGTPVTAWEANTVYTLKIYHGGALAIAICMDDTTFEAGTLVYFDNSIINSNDEYVAPDPGIPLLKSSGDASTTLPVYEGDVTALGFAEGSVVQYKETQDLIAGSLWWQTEDYPDNLHRQQNNPVILPSADYPVVSIEFALSKAIVSGSVFYVWAYDNAETPTHLGGGAINVGTTWAATGFAGAIYNTDGTIASSLEANTVYVLKLRMEGAYKFNVANIADAGMTTYYAANSLAYLDDEAPEFTVLQGDDRHAIPTYDGDAATLGFAEGTTVYVLDNTQDGGWGDDAWGNRAIIPAPTTQDYVTFEFVAANNISGSVFHLWGVAGAPSIGSVNVSTTDIALITDMDGYAVTSIEAGQHYLFNIACADLSEIQVGLIYGINTVYFANVTYNNGTFKALQPEVDTISSGASNTAAVSVYEGDVTALGFAEGTSVYQFVCENSGTDKAAIKVDPTYDYVDVEFVIAEGDGYFFLHGLKDGSWYNSGTSYVIDASWIRLGDGNNTASDRTIEVFDADGNKVTTMMETNVVYTLRVYVKLGELDQIMISKGGSTIYFGDVTYGNDVVEDVESEVQA